MKKIAEVTQIAGEKLPENLLANAQPMVLKGYISDWPIVEQTKSSSIDVMDHLISFYNERPVHVMRSDAQYKGRLFYKDDLSDFNFTRTRENLREVFNQLKHPPENNTPDTIYVGSTAIDHIFPGLRANNDLPALTSKALVSIWMGNQSRVAAHYDAPDNIACVVAGKRRFTLFPPNQIDNLYIGPLDYTPAGQPASLVDFHNPDFKRFPKFAEALKHAIVAELNPGDALYIPSMWWHHVEGLSDFNILVNYWWRQVDNFVGAPADALLHGILSIRELPAEQRQYWQEIFDYYVFNPVEQSHIPQHKMGILDPLNSDLSRTLRSMLINKLNR